MELAFEEQSVQLQQCREDLTASEAALDEERTAHDAARSAVVALEGRLGEGADQWKTAEEILQEEVRRLALELGELGRRMEAERRRAEAERREASAAHGRYMDDMAFQVEQLRRQLESEVDRVGQLEADLQDVSEMGMGDGAYSGYPRGGGGGGRGGGGGGGGGGSGIGGSRSNGGGYDRAVGGADVRDLVRQVGDLEEQVLERDEQLRHLRAAAEDVRRGGRGGTGGTGGRGERDGEGEGGTALVAGTGSDAGGSGVGGEEVVRLLRSSRDVVSEVELLVPGVRALCEVLQTHLTGHQPSLSSLLDSPARVPKKDARVREEESHYQMVSDICALHENITDLRGTLADAYAEGMADNCNMQ